MPFAFSASILRLNCQVSSDTPKRRGVRRRVATFRAPRPKRRNNRSETGESADLQLDQQIEEQTIALELLSGGPSEAWYK